MSVSTRRDRASILPYVDGAPPSYGASRGTFFCRVSYAPGGQFSSGAQSEHSQSAVFEFAGGVTMTENDLVVDAASNRWKIDSLTRRTKPPAKIIVRASRIELGAAVTFTLTRRGSRDESTDLSGAATVTTVVGTARQTEGDAERYRALGLDHEEAITLVFTPTTPGEIPALGSTFSWRSIAYEVREAESLNPAGITQAVRVIGAR